MAQLVGGIILLIVTEFVGAQVLKFTAGGGNIVAGGGYSSDKQQIVPQRCYNATVSSASDQEGFAQLGASQSFSALENVLGVSVSAGVGFWRFSAEAKASYMRSIQDKDYSMSLNYYQYARNKVAVQLLGFGEEALIESFQRYYDGGKNPYFGLFCGDYYIGSYLQGAVLTMGLNIEFSSSDAKTEFSEKAGFTFGDIVSAAQSVKSIVTENKIKGSVTIHAFQMGGEPSQLAHILSHDSSGQYYALACSLTAMDKCIKAASGLLDYARNKFSNQFSTQNNTGLTPLGISFTDFIPIKYAGLAPPNSLVSPEVEQCRNELFNRLMENEYYQQKLYPFLHKGYPVELDANFLKNASSVLSKANRNVAVLMQVHGGAADCFNFPDMCESLKTSVDSKLQNITAEDLQFLEAVKYTLTTRGGVLYNTAKHSLEDTDSTTWQAVPDNKPGKESVGNIRIYLTENAYKYVSAVFVKVPGDQGCLYTYVGKSLGVSSDGTITYRGVMQYQKPGKPDTLHILSDNHQEYKRMSPFFFGVYNATTQGQRYQTNKKLRFQNHSYLV